MDTLSFNDRTVLITGAARRLGAALAVALAKQGARLVIHYNHSQDEALELAREIKDFGGAVYTLKVNLSESGAAEHLVEQAIDVAGPLDILINNASIFHDVAFMDTTACEIQDNMAVNAIAPFLLSRAFARQQRKGAIINMLDALVMDYDKKHLPYHLSKRTLQTLTSIMAVEFAPLVRVNAVAPGLILPPEGKDIQYLKNLAHSNPLQSYGSPEEIVEAVLYLLTADFVTGQTIFVDGGRHLEGRMYE